MILARVLCRTEVLLTHRTIAMAAADVPEAWKLSGQKKGPGIPAPSGQYRVGCVDLMHQLEGDDKGLLVRLHYPTEATPAAGYAYSQWYPHHKYISGYMEIENNGDVTLGEDVLAKITKPQFPALDEAPLFGVRNPIGRAPPTFPVIVFSHGLGGMRTCNSGFACDLASHGYVVACVEHRDGSACVSMQRVPKVGGAGKLEDSWLKYYHLRDGEKEFPLRNRQVKQRADEVSKSLDILTLLNEGAEVRNMLEGSYDFKQFKGRMDTSKAAVMGHSFGGGTTVLALSQDARLKCGLAMDSWMVPLHSDFYKQADFSKPLYFVNTHTFQWVLNVQRMMSLTKPPDKHGITPSRVLTLKGTHHFNQCDLPFVSPQTLHRAGLKESTLNSETAHQVNMDICLAFLRRHLLQDAAYVGVVPDLDGSEGHSEHIIFGTNLDLTEGSPAGYKAPQPDLNSHL